MTRSRESTATVSGRLRDDPFAGCQLLGREEAGAAVSHRQERLASHRRIELEPEQDCHPLAEEPGDPDVVADHLADAGQPAVEGHRRVEQPIHGQPLGLEVDAQIAGEDQVGLARLHRDAGRNPLAVQVPRIRLDHMLRDDPPVPEAIAASPSMVRSDRRASRAHRAGGPCTGKRSTSANSGTEDRGHRSHGELQALPAVEQDALGRVRYGERIARRKHVPIASGQAEFPPLVDGLELILECFPIKSAVPSARRKKRAMSFEPGDFRIVERARLRRESDGSGTILGPSGLIDNDQSASFGLSRNSRWSPACGRSEWGGGHRFVTLVHGRIRRDGRMYRVERKGRDLRIP